MSPRAHGNGVRKVCRHGWRRWPKCPCAWYFSYKPRGGGARYRFSLDGELGRHIESKSEAEQIARDIRHAIHAGTFNRIADAREAPAQSQRPTTSGVTLDQFAATFIERAAKASGKASWKDDEYLLGTVRDHRTVDGGRLGDRPLATITEDDFEAFHAAQRSAGRAASTLNHFVQVLTAACRWAVRKGYLTRSPISEGSALKRSKMAKRTRRVPPEEEAALLAAASPRLQQIIIAAVETGMRRGEILGLLWRDVSLETRVLTVRAEHAKDNEARLIPISARLAGFLKMATTDPAGRDYPPEAYVFGELGERVWSIKKSWETTVLKANAITPVWVGGTLSADCRAHLRRIDLHFHDLRREAGSRWHEGGFQLHEVRDLLGHANVSQTDTYLSAKISGLRESMRRFDAFRGKTVAKQAGTEHRPVGHDAAEESEKAQLH